MKKRLITYLTNEGYVTTSVTQEQLGQQLTGYNHVMVEHVLDCLAFIIFLQQDGRELPAGMKHQRSLSNLKRRLEHTLAVLSPGDTDHQLERRLNKRLADTFIEKVRLYAKFGAMSWEEVLVCTTRP